MAAGPSQVRAVVHDDLDLVGASSFVIVADPFELVSYGLVKFLIVVSFDETFGAIETTENGDNVARVAEEGYVTEVVDDTSFGNLFVPSTDQLFVHFLG